MKEKAKIEAILNEKENLKMSIGGSGQDLLIMAYIIIKHLSEIF